MFFFKISYSMIRKLLSLKMLMITNVCYLKDNLTGINFSNHIFVFLKFIYFNWRILVLRYCVGFCHTSMWASHSRLMPPPSWTSLPSSTPLSCHRAPDLGSLHHTANSHWFSILQMVTYASMLLLIHPTLSFPTVSTTLFTMSPSPLLPCI